MSVVYIALPVALVLAAAAVLAFIWAVRSGQMDDLETPGVRLLGEPDEQTRRPPEPSKDLDEEPTD